MKGPPARSRHDVRRIWECPHCSRRILTGGNVVSQSCACRSAADPPVQTWMRLVETRIPPDKLVAPPPADPTTKPVE
jgi:hypothetical protein